MSALSMPYVQPRRGEVWLASLDPIVGHEQGGVRPALVISTDRFNAGRSRMVGLVPLTTRDRGSPLHVRIAPPEGGLNRPSVILCDHLRIGSQLRLRHQLGVVDPATVQDVEEVVRLLFGL